MEGCQLYAVRGGDSTVFMRNFGSGKIVATNKEVGIVITYCELFPQEIEITDNGNLHPVPSQIFTLAFSYAADDNEVTAKMTPIEYNAVSTYSISSFLLSI